LFDKLHAVHETFSRGLCGTLKPMTMTSAQLSRIASSRPRDMKAFEKLVGERQAQRFGVPMLEIIQSA
jgi:ATP-dependent DNA helicase RecQ